MFDESHGHIIHRCGNAMLGRNLRILTIATAVGADGDLNSQLAANPRLVVPVGIAQRRFGAP